MPIVPAHLFAAKILPDFEWDEADVLQYFYFLPAELHDRLLKLTRNGSYALSIGSAIWILARFATIDPDRKARDFAVANWAEMAPGWRVQRVWPEDQDYAGPVRGPILMAMTILYDILDGRGDNPEIADRATWMHNLALHVIPEGYGYQQWFEAAVERLSACHSWQVEGGREPDLFDDAFPRGAAVAPDVLMPDQSYDPALALEYLERLFRHERRDGNPYILASWEHGIDHGDEDEDGHDHGRGVPLPE